MSEMASPAAVVEILMTQKSTVTSGTFAARGCWVKMRISERTLWVSLSGPLGENVRRPWDRRRRRSW